MSDWRVFRGRRPPLLRPGHKPSKYGPSCPQNSEYLGSHPRAAAARPKAAADNASSDATSLLVPVPLSTRFFAVRPRHVAVGERQIDVFINRQVPDQVERLKDEADLAVTTSDKRLFCPQQIQSRPHARS